MSNPPLDKENFFRRMKRLYAAWKVSLIQLRDYLANIPTVCMSMLQVDDFRQKHVTECPFVLMKILHFFILAI